MDKSMDKRRNALEAHQYAEVGRVLDEVLELWEVMKRSDMEEAEDDADRFQMRFYVLMDTVREWIRVMENRPEDMTAAQSDERFAILLNALPGELQVPFELELDSALSNADESVE